MKSLVVGIAISLVGASAFAQFSPKLAYSKAGNGKVVATVYLANADNTTSVAIYNSSKNIQALAAKSGQLAVGTNDGLRLVSYSVSGNSVSASSPVQVESSTIFGAAYSPDGSKIAYAYVTSGSTSSIRIRNLSDNSVSDVAPTASIIENVAWVGSRIVYSFGTSAGISVHAYDTVSSSDVEVLNTASQEMGNIDGLAAAHVSNSVVFSGGCKVSAAVSCGKGINLYQLDLDSLVLDRLTIGMLDQFPALDASDAKVTYTEIANSKNSSAVYLMRKDLSSGIVTKLGNKTDSYRNLCSIP